MPSFRSRESYSLSSVLRRKPSTLRVYGALVLFMVGLVFLVDYIRSAMPLTDNGDFQGEHAFRAYLSQFTEPHPGNSRANGAMRDWLVSVSHDLKAKAAENGIIVDIVANDSSRAISKADGFVKDEQWFVESRNIIVRVHGQSGTEQAIMINAHYDSVPTSNGVTDDGAGVAVELELLRYFVHRPPRHTLIFLFNNLEEGGLFGAHAFATHPWFPTVRLFINLEGAGAGGPAIIFRASSVFAMDRIAASGARFIQVSPTSNDVFQYQLIRSDTDYSVFTSHGIPGLDIAFYKPRSYYHTPRDRLEFASPEMLRHMGDMVLGALNKMNENDDVFKHVGIREKPVYYDILGRFLITHSIMKMQVIHAIALIGVPVLFVCVAILTVQRADRMKNLKQKAVKVVQGTTMTLIAFVIVITVVSGASFAMARANPSMTYGNINLAAGYVGLAALFGLLLAELACQKLGKTHHRDGLEIYLYGASAYGWLLVVAAALAASYNLISFYFAVYVLACTTAATVIHLATKAHTVWHHPVIFLIQVLCPTTLLLDLGSRLMVATRHTTPDGTSEFLAYGVTAVPSIIIAMQLLPWIHFAGSQRKATAITGISLIFMFTICSALKPFNAGLSPNKLVFHQTHDLTNSLSTVKLVTATNLPETLKYALPPSEFDTLRCKPRGRQTECDYDTALVPKYAVPGEVSVTANKTCDGTKCRVEGSTVSLNSLMCRVELDHSVQRVWVNEDIVKEKTGAIVWYTNTYGAVVRWGFEYTRNESVVAKAGCYYDEWTRGEIPAFSALKDNLPSDTELLIRGNGLALVYFTTFHFED